MGIPEAAVQQSTGSGQDHELVVNNFSIQVATVNGSGSQSANSVLMRSIFEMGVPVSGKNLFPSNIAGLPTWFTIRASKHGYVARKSDSDVLIAMNRDSAAEDVAALKPGSVVLYDEPLQLATLRDDLTFYAAPIDKLAAPLVSEAKLKKLLRNMIYVGMAAYLFGLEMAAVEDAIGKQFQSKKKAAELNVAAARAGYEYASANFAPSRFRVERMEQSAGKILIDGNSAAALGALALPVSALLGIGLFALCSLGLQGRGEQPARMRWLVAFVFGLIHGFGFAGVLAEVGLPPGRTAAALLGFNLGVELGQLVIVALCWPLLWLAMRRAPAQRRLLIQLGSSPILAAGLYWFLGRSLA